MCENVMHKYFNRFILFLLIAPLLINTKIIKVEATELEGVNGDDPQGVTYSGCEAGNFNECAYPPVIAGYRLTFINSDGERYAGTRPVEVRSVYGEDPTGGGYGAEGFLLEGSTFLKTYGNNKPYLVTDLWPETNYAIDVIRINYPLDITSGNQVHKDILEVDTNFSLAPDELLDYLKNATLLNFQNHNYTLVELLYMWSKMKTEGCNIDSTDKCQENYAIVQSEMEGIIDKKDNEKIRNYNDFINSAYIVIEPLWFSSPENFEQHYIYTPYELARYYVDTATHEFPNGNSSWGSEYNRKEIAYKMACENYVITPPSELKPHINPASCDTMSEGTMDYFKSITITHADTINSRGYHLYRLKDQVSQEGNCEITMNYCSSSNTTNNYDNGVFGMKADFGEHCVNGVDQFRYGGLLSNTYCYDEEIQYNFSEALKYLSDNKFGNYTWLNVPNGELKITRVCYTASKTNIFTNSFIGSMVNNAKQNVQLSVLGTKYDFKRQSWTNKQVTDTGSRKAITITIPYRISKNKLADLGNIFIPYSTKNGNYSGTLELNIGNIKSLSNQNSKIIGEMKNDKTSIEYKMTGTDGITTTYNMSYNINNNNGANFSCKYNLNVEGSNLDECVGECCDGSCVDSVDSVNVKFRTISLSYPFSAQDGKNRLPGLNWLNNENYVYKYITNNRNIQTDRNKVTSPEMIYINSEPLYTITLDASNMIKIRSYNQTNSYDKMQLNCKGTTGRECTSSFLRNTTYVPSLGGTCRNSVANNSGVNATYYSCADKTAESGG